MLQSLESILSLTLMMWLQLRHIKEEEVCLWVTRELQRSIQVNKGRRALVARDPIGGKLETYWELALVNNNNVTQSLSFINNSRNNHLMI